MNDKKKTIEWRPASTVILTREGEGDLEVYLLQRNPKAGFFPGYYVFPGGVVEPDDWVKCPLEIYGDLDQESFSKQLSWNQDLKEALAYALSAIRETFEEAGVLLVDQTDRIGGELEDLCARRLGEGLSKGWFRDQVWSEGWPLSFSRLVRWAHWITPRLMRSHFDTRFYVAVLPPGQTCSPDENETVHGIWVSPEKALKANYEGEIPLSPPTFVTLHELLAYKDLSELEKALKTRPWGGGARFPRLVPLSDGALILQPWDPMRYGEVKVDAGELEEMILPVGEPFSRLWLNKGIWRPVKV
jgi:8-oxo-dGTP pyrophosphatase MutT (NUDIX family)